MNPSMKLTLQESMKLLGEMTLLNRFLFSEVMSDLETYTATLQIDSFDEGMEKATLKSLQKLMQKQHMTAEEALDFLEVPKEEWENYIPKLQNQ